MEIRIRALWRGKAIPLVLFTCLTFSAFAKAGENPSRVEVSLGFDSKGDTLSLVYLSGSVYDTKLIVLNYYELKYSHELPQFFITDYPEIQKLSLLLGYQYSFHLWHIFVPMTGGISNGFGVDRGRYIRRANEDSTCILCYSDRYFEKKRNYLVGWFLEASPTLMLNGCFFGLKFNLNRDTRFMTTGGGITVGIPLFFFKSTGR